MKRLYFFIVAVFFTAASLNAQVAKTSQEKTQNKEKAECYLMKDGKMYHVMGGKEMLLEKEVTLKNGEVIMPNGMCKMKDGEEMMLNNGECVDHMGVFHKSHMKHAKKV